MKCYMCESGNTTREHVPPECFFPPEHKLNLITVPSCPEHNLKKSKDDEYVRSIIAPYLTTNSVGQDMAMTKVNRSFQHSKGLVAAVFKQAKLLKLENGAQSVSLKVDLTRWDAFFRDFSRAIYFHDFKTSHRQDWVIITPSLFYSDSIDKGQPNPYAPLHKKLLSLNFVEVKTFNPKVFRYGLFRHSATSYAYKFVFYEGFVVCALSTATDVPSHNTEKLRRSIL